MNQQAMPSAETLDLPLHPQGLQDMPDHVRADTGAIAPEVGDSERPSLRDDRAAHEFGLLAPQAADPSHAVLEPAEGGLFDHIPVRAFTLKIQRMGLNTQVVYL
jgi:hypothetical protein